LDERHETLQATIKSIQQRFGEDALQASDAYSEWATIPTGYPLLDDMLGGGIPRQRLTEVTRSSTSTSGALTLVLHTIAQAQAAADPVIYIDLPHTLNPAYAASLGVSLDNLLLVRPPSASMGLSVLRDVLHTPTPCFIMLDASSESHLPAKKMQQLSALLKRSRATLIILSNTDEGLTSTADVRLTVQLKNWLYEGARLSGYTSRVTIIKRKNGSIGSSVLIDVPVLENAA